jgi:hypothetical protein
MIDPLEPQTEPCPDSTWTLPPDAPVEELTPVTSAVTCNVCGNAKEIRVIPDREHPVLAAGVQDSPILIIADEPERVKGSPATGGPFPTNIVLYREQRSYSGPFKQTFRILVYHVNSIRDLTDPDDVIDAPIRSYALFLHNTGSTSIKASCLLGRYLHGDHFNNNNFAGAAYHCLNRSLPRITTARISGAPANYVLGEQIAPDTKLRIYRENDLPAVSAGDPRYGMFAALVEITIENYDLAGTFSFDIYSSCCGQGQNPLSVTGSPYILIPNCNNAQEPWLGHPRGTWQYSELTGPLAGSDEVLEAVPDQDSFIQFTMGRADCLPRGQDIGLYEGSTSSPFGRANRGLYAVTQKV